MTRLKKIKEMKASGGRLLDLGLFENPMLLDGRHALLLDF